LQLRNKSYLMYPSIKPQEEPSMAAKHILFLVGDFVEDYEIMVPFQALAAEIGRAHV